MFNSILSLSELFRKVQYVDNKALCIYILTFNSMYHIIEQCHYVGLGPTQGYQIMEITAFPTYTRHKALSS